MQYWFFPLLIFLAQLSHCSSVKVDSDIDQSAITATATENSTSKRRMAIRAGWQKEEWLLVSAVKTEQERETLHQLFKEIAEVGVFGKKYRLIDIKDLTPDTLGNNSVLMVGNDIPSKVWPQLNAENAENFLGYDLTRPKWMLRSFFLENPWTPADTSIAMHLIYGENISDLTKQIRQEYADDEWYWLFRTRYGYLIDEGEEARLRGNFDKTNWRPNPDEDLIFKASGEPVYEDSALKLFAPDGTSSRKNISDVADLLLKQKNRLAGWFGKDSLPQLELHLYPTLERISLRRQDMNEVQFNASNHSLHLSLDDIDANLESAEMYYCLLKWLRQFDDIPKLTEQNDYLDRGLAALASNEITLTKAAENELTSQGIILSKKQLSTVNRGQYSSYLYDLSAAAQSIQALSVSGLNLEPGLLDFSEELPKIPLQTSFQKGITFAHEGYQITNGYGGSTVEESMDSLLPYNINSIAVVPYTFQRDPLVAGELPVSVSAGGENNGATRSSIRRAHQRGMSVMLKPQIWVGQGSWPGDIDMDSEEAWDGWFKRYSEWILNYALLAQAEEVQSLCIGTELRYTTLKQPERWRKLIRAIRSVYSGKLTYAANWGDEFEQLSFWDDLDYIGLNSYYPLSKKEVVTDQELLQGARNWVIMANEVAKQHAKQWWLTEVGYRSVSQAWINPHANPDDRNADLETQSRCYRALFTALTEKADQLTGVYVWKWPSYLDHGYRRGRGEVGFTPNAKPAISVLGDYYERQ